MNDDLEKPESAVAGACEVVTTRGGARAVLDRATGEVMHPIVGPRVEASRLYVGPSRLAERLREEAPRPLVLLDVGLGAGSNAIAAWSTAAALPGTARRLEIVSFDRSLAAIELALRPEHAEAFALDGEAGAAARELLAFHRHEGPRVSWRLVLGELPATLDAVPAGSADVVFWDPFSPKANPHLWSVGAFAALRRACADGATVFTYSGATATRSAMLLGGFAVGFGESTGENKEATVAAVRAGDLARPLDRRWLSRLGRSSAAFPSDAPADALDRISRLEQFRAP